MSNVVYVEHRRGGLALLGETRWAPNRGTIVAAGSYLAVVGSLLLAFQVFTTARVAANFITYGIVTLTALGVALPVLYTTVVERRPLADLAITTHNLIPALALGLLLGLDTYRATLANVAVSWGRAQVPLIAMALAVGLFEAVFFRGWLQLRFEKAFGPVPGLVLGALCYMLYHVGYGMTWQEMLPLFGYGLVFGAVFRLTGSIFVLWPFYTAVGGLYTTLTDGLTMPFEATIGFVLVLVMMAAVIAAGALRVRALPRPELRFKTG